MKDCEGCAKCCYNVIVEFDKPSSKEDFDEIKWKVSHENVQVYIDDDNSWNVEFITKCKELDEKGLCKIYDKRPRICRDHEPDNCIENGEGDYFKRMFKTIQDVEDFMNERKMSHKKRRGKK